VSTELDAFLEELRNDARLASSADDLAEVLEQLDIEADYNRHACQLFDGLMWIARQPRPLLERVEKQHALLSLRGRVCIDMKAWSGW
jgi:hypothetical protein